MRQPKEDNFSRYMRRALAGQEDFWLLKLLYPVRRSEPAHPDRAPLRAWMLRLLRR